MALAKSKLTAQGQISVPVEIRRKLGIGPGAVLEWDEADGVIVVRRAGQFTSQQIHDAVFGSAAPTRRSDQALKAGIRKNIRQRHARH